MRETLAYCTLLLVEIWPVLVSSPALVLLSKISGIKRTRQCRDLLNEGLFLLPAF